MNALALLPDAPLDVEWSPYHLAVIDPSLSFDRFESLIYGASDLSDATRYWIGDLLLFGEARYGERVSQVMDETGISYDQALRYRLVCERIAPSRRRQWGERADQAGIRLRWTHLHALGRFETPAEQEQWFDRLLDKRMTPTQLREAIRDRKAVDREFSGLVPRPTAEVLGAESVDAVRELGAVKATLAQVATAVTDADAAEALGLPRAIRAVEQIGRTVRQAAATLARTGLRDAAARVRAVAVKQGTSFPEPAYLVPAEALEALFSALDAEPVRTHEGGGR